MFFTGYSRDADLLLGEQRRRTEQGEDAMVASLRRVEEIGFQTREALEGGDLAGVGSLFHEHWLSKRERSKGISNSAIDRWYDVGMRKGALGGKLTGAGGGGFLLFLAEDPTALRRAMQAEGLPEVRFGFDYDGSSLVVRD
jgi:D-glycero-alpha-D-manno-heptose-7-phosphate kinase